MNFVERLKNLSVFKKSILIIFTLAFFFDIFFLLKTSFVIPNEESYTGDYYDEDYEETSYFEEEKTVEKVSFVNEKEITRDDMLSVYNKYDFDSLGVFDPKNIDFDNEIVYKGIQISWTDEAPIYSERLEWLKDVIDLLPQSFLEKYPIGGFYSATEDDYPEEWHALSLAAAFASGSNIYLMPVMASESMPGLYEQYTKEYFAKVIYHEWAHVIQFYDIFYTYDEAYLDSLVQNGVSLSAYMMQSSNIVFDFATKVGWLYEYDDIEECIGNGFCLDYTFCPYYYGNTAEKPSNNPDFLKTTDYALESYTSGGIEDMAETFSHFIVCDNSVEFSKERTEWVEKYLGNSKEYYCNSNIF